MRDAPGGTGFQGSSPRYLEWPRSQPSLVFIHQALVGRIVLRLINEEVKRDVPIIE
jgi:hypothetical protein